MTDFRMLLGLVPPYPIPEDAARRALKDEPPDTQIALITPERHAMRGLSQDKRGVWISRTVVGGVYHEGGRSKDLDVAKANRDALELRLGKTISMQLRKPKKVPT